MCCVLWHCGHKTMEEGGRRWYFFSLLSLLTPESEWVRVRPLPQSACRILYYFRFCLVVIHQDLEPGVRCASGMEHELPERPAQEIWSPAGSLSQLRSKDLRIALLPTFKGWESICEALKPLKAGAVRIWDKSFRRWNNGQEALEGWQHKHNWFFFSSSLPSPRLSSLL